MDYIKDYAKNLFKGNSIISVVMIDKNYNILMCNERFKKIVGDANISNGDSFSKIMAFFGEKFKRRVDTSFTGTTSELEHKSMIDDRYFESIIRPLRDDNNNIYASVVTTKDITERMNRLLLLIHNEEELKALYDNAPLGYQSLDKYGRFLYVNDTLSNMLEYSKEELIGEWFGDFLVSSGSATFKKNFPLFKEKGETKVNIEMQTKSGKVLTIMFDGKIAYKDDGSFKQTHCILKDISENTKIIEELNQTKLLLGASLESPKDIIILSLDTEYKYLFFNNTHKVTMKAVYGKEIEIGASIFDYMTSESDINKSKESYSRALKGETHTTIDQYGGLNTDFYESIFSPIKNEQNQIMGVSIFSRNITERINSINEIKKEKDLVQKYVVDLESVGNIFENSIENAPLPVMIHAVDGTVLNISKMWTILTKYEKTDIPTIFDWTERAYGKKKDEVINFINKLYKLDKVQHDGEFEVTTKDGRKLTWDFNSGYIGNLPDGRAVAMSVAIDITEDKVKFKEKEELLISLQQTKTLLNSSLESPKDMIILSIDNNYCYYYFNENYKETIKNIYGKDIDIGMNILDILTIEKDRKLAKVNYDIALSGKAHSKIQKYGENNEYSYESYFYPIFDSSNKIIGASVFAREISERINSQKHLKESEEKFRLLYSSMSQGLALHEVVYNESGNPETYRYIEINNSYSKLFNLKKEDVIGKTVHEVVPNIEQYWIDSHISVALTGEPKYTENYSRSIDKYISTYAYSPKKGQFAVLISDISDRIKKEEEINYLSFNDQLTGVYNRRYYEEQMTSLDIQENLPLSLIMGDVNGLKLVNDSFGHLVGDELLKKVALVLKKACRSNDIISRIGGDEFVVILPKTSKEVAEKVTERITALCENESVKSIGISVSFGFGTKNNSEERLDNIFKDIEDDMYRKKLNESTSMRSKTIDLIITTLYEKNDREMSHSKRVSFLSAAFAKALKLNKDSIKQVEIAGLMHDIGKIGIEENILNKTGLLNEDEWDKVKRHSEIGYRILSSVNEFSEIAEQVLQHHENWDGSGYPKGLKGEEVLLQARIIHITDAYDAMTGTRTYKKALSKEEALKELEKFSGTQFDPNLVKVFLEKVATTRILDQDKID